MRVFRWTEKGAPTEDLALDLHKPLLAPQFRFGDELLLLLEWFVPKTGLRCYER